MEIHSKGLFKLQTIGQQIKWLVENNIMHEGILEELSSLTEFVECFKLLNCDEPSLEQLPKAIFKVKNCMNGLKRLLELKESKPVLEHEVKCLNITLKHLDLIFRGETTNNYGRATKERADKLEIEREDTTCNYNYKSS